MVDKLKAGAPFADVAAAEGLKRADHVRAQARRNPARPSRRDVLEAVFQTDKDAAGSAEGNEPDRTDRVPGDRHHGAGTSTPHRRRPSASPTTCARQSARICIAQYIKRLQTDLGVTINQDALRRRRSGGEQRA